MKIFYCIKRFWEIPTLEKHFFLFGIVLSLLLKILISFLPAKLYLPILQSKSNSKSQLSSRVEAYKLANLSIKRVSKYSFWHCSCFVKSIIMKKYLNFLGIPSTIVLSLRKSNDKNLVAHSYLQLEGNYHFHKKSGYQGVWTF
jgi:hypothetical protein